MNKKIDHHNEQTKAWADLVKQTADARRIKKLASVVSERAGVDHAVAVGWLAGHDVPREREQHNAIMGVIGLEPFDSEAFFEENSAPKRAVMTRARDIEGLWNEALQTVAGTDIDPPEVEKPATKKKATPGTTVRVGGGVHKAKNVYYDSPDMPNRMNADDSSPYEWLDEGALQSIQQYTENFPEFLKVSRLLKGWTQAEFGKKVASEVREERSECAVASRIRSYEVGQNRPTYKGPLFPKGDLLPMLSQLFGKDTVLYQRGVELLIRNRTDLMKRATEEGEALGYGALIRSMPAVYFQERLMNTNEVYGVKRDESVNSPYSWNDVAPVFDDRNRYCFAAMHALERVEGISRSYSRNIFSARDSLYNYISEEVWSSLFDHLEAEQTQALADGRLNTPVFSRQVAEELPVAQKSRADVLRERAAKTADEAGADKVR